VNLCEVGMAITRFAPEDEMRALGPFPYLKRADTALDIDVRGPEKVIPKISQETLAEMVGTTRSRVNLFMNRFRKLGFISYNGELEVHSSLLNVVLHDSADLCAISNRGRGAKVR
jgi:hypothetical protein